MPLIQQLLVQIETDNGIDDYRLWPLGAQARMFTIIIDDDDSIDDCEQDDYWCIGERFTYAWISVVNCILKCGGCIDFNEPKRWQLLMNCIRNRQNAIRAEAMVVMITMLHKINQVLVLIWKLNSKRL
jgi:hypothetical protein